MDLEIIASNRSNDLFPAPADTKPTAELVSVLGIQVESKKYFSGDLLEFEYAGIRIKLMTSNLQRQLGETRGLAVLDSFTAEFDKKIQRLSKKLEDCI